MTEMVLVTWIMQPTSFMLQVNCYIPANCYRNNFGRIDKLRVDADVGHRWRIHSMRKGVNWKVSKRELNASFPLLITKTSFSKHYSTQRGVIKGTGVHGLVTSKFYFKIKALITMVKGRRWAVFYRASWAFMESEISLSQFFARRCTLIYGIYLKWGYCVYSSAHWWTSWGWFIFSSEDGCNCAGPTVNTA